jgi:hypothetical protein
VSALACPPFFGPRRIPVHKAKKNQLILIYIVLEYEFAAVSQLEPAESPFLKLSVIGS